MIQNFKHLLRNIIVTVQVHKSDSDRTTLTSLQRKISTERLKIKIITMIEYESASTLVYLRTKAPQLCNEATHICVIPKTRFPKKSSLHVRGVPLHCNDRYHLRMRLKCYHLCHFRVSQWCYHQLDSEKHVVVIVFLVGFGRFRAAFVHQCACELLQFRRRSHHPPNHPTFKRSIVSH